MHSVNEISNWFLYAVDRESGDSITHLKLQKIVYYAQAWSLALSDKELFKEDFQAWAHGPVLRTLFDTYTGSGWEALDLPKEDAPKFDEDTTELLNDIWEIYGQHTAKYLEELTHEESPWKDARGDLSPEARSDSIIPKHEISSYYKDVYKNLSNG